MAHGNISKLAEITDNIPFDILSIRQLWVGNSEKKIKLLILQNAWFLHSYNVTV